MIYETDLDTYEKLKVCLFELFPEIEVKLITSDPMLKSLGFVDKVPCQVEVCATKEQIEEICDMAIDLEVIVYSTTDSYYINENDENYKKYIRYAWLYDFFS